MSEHDEQRPLTRRELRLREMGETGALDLSEVSDAVAAPEPTASEAPAAPVAEATGDIEISPVNEDGTPRSRREMRQLREEALAARAATQAEGVPAQGAEDHTDPAPAEDSTEAPEDETAASNAEPAAPAESPEEAPAEAAEAPEDAAETEPAEPAAPLTGEMDFDSLISPPTEPFTVDELRDAEAERENAETEDAPAAEDVPKAVEPTEQPEEAAEEAPADEDEEPAGKTKRRFPWSRGRASEADAAEDTAAAEDADAPAADAVAEDAEPTVPETGQVADVIVPVDEPADLPEAPATEPTIDEEPEAPAVEAKPSYSFPDIAPPEEWRSVFDDPATRSMPAQNGDAQGGFDDLISRAVAQEGAAGTTNTSALILPTMPEETTGGLTGPLGGTGDLYVTGSLKLPKSLGETGGHSSLHDSIELDPITGVETGDPQTTGQGPAPVSARHAVSARVDSTIPVVAKPAKERSKLPLILSLTGGGLLLAVVALGIWGASNGMFG